MRLLVGDDDQAVVVLVLVEPLDGVAEESPVVTLRGIDRSAQSEAWHHARSYKDREL